MSKSGYLCIYLLKCLQVLKQIEYYCVAFLQLLWGSLCLGWQPNISKLSEEEPSALFQVGEQILLPAEEGVGLCPAPGHGSLLSRKWKGVLGSEYT